MVILLYILLPIFETFHSSCLRGFSGQKWRVWCHEIIKITSSTCKWAGPPLLLPLNYESENSMKSRNFWNLVFSNTFYDFRSGLYTLIDCLKSWLHKYVRNFYVTCIPFVYQPKGKVQSAVIHPALLHNLFVFWKSIW